MKTRLLHSKWLLFLWICCYLPCSAQVENSYTAISKQIDSIKHLVVVAKQEKRPHCRQYVEIISLYQDLIMVDSAFFYGKKGIELAQQEKDFAAESRLWGLLASTTYYTGDYEKGMGWAKKSLQIAQEAQLDSLVVTRLNIIGLFYIETNRNREAIPYYKQALALYEQLPESKKSDYVKGDLYRICANMAEAYENLKDYETAIKFHQRSLEEAEKRKAYRAMAIAKIHLAKCQNALGNKKEVVPSLEEAVKYSTLIEDWDMLNGSLMSFVDFYTQERQFDKAEAILQQSLSVIQKDTNRISIKSKKNLFSNSYRFYKTQGKFDQALLYLEKANEIDKIIYQRRSSNTIDLANIEFNTLAKEQEKTKAENAKKQAEVWLLLVSLISLLSILILSVIVFLKTRKALLQAQELSLKEKIKEKEIKEAVFYTQETERERIAKELHDSVGTMLAVIRLQIEIYSKTKDESLLASVFSSLQNTTQEVRRISHALMPFTLSQLGFAAALEDLCRSHETPIQLDIPEQLPRFEQQEEILLFRICQEAVHNALKHAQATSLYIRVLVERSTLFVQIKDDGKGFDVQHTQNGMGFVNMHSRAATLGAWLQIKSQANKGTIICLEWLIPEKHKAAALVA